MDDPDGVLAHCDGPSASVAARTDFINMVIGAWGITAALVAPVMIVAAYAGHLMRLPAVEDAAVVAGEAAVFFCLAGVVTGFWWKHHAKQARRRARRHGAQSTAGSESLHRSRPRDGSLVFQTLVAVVAAGVALAGVR